MPVIDVQKTGFEYGPNRGLGMISFSVASGSCVAVLGRNGSGKSTLTRLLLGLIRPQSGNVRVLGVNVSSGGRGHLKNIGVVLEQSVHWEHLSGFQNAWFKARSRGNEAGLRERLHDLFSGADLMAQADDPVSAWSFGMRRKLSMVEAFVHDPELMIMDEPTIGVDHQFMLTLLDWIAERTRRGKTTWIAGNDPEWVSQISSHVMFLDRGRMADFRRTANVLNEAANLREFRIGLSHYTRLSPPAMKGLKSWVQNGTEITAVAEDSGHPGWAALAGWIESSGGVIRSMQSSGGTLKDVYLLKTGFTVDE